MKNKKIRDYPFPTGQILIRAAAVFEFPVSVLKSFRLYFNKYSIIIKTGRSAVILPF